MARLFPSRLVGTVSPEVAKVVQSLKRIPGDELMVWIRLPLGGSWRPALMVLDWRGGKKMDALRTNLAGH